MKEFNLEEAKAGKPVCTRDGEKARILAFDLNGYDGLSIVAAITHKDGCEATYEFCSNGQIYQDSITPIDLMMYTEKKQGWINVYKSASHRNRAVTWLVYETKEIAKNNADKDDDYIGTFPFEWEE